VVAVVVVGPQALLQPRRFIKYRATLWEGWGWGRSHYRYAALRYIAYTRQLASGKSVTNDTHRQCLISEQYSEQSKVPVHAMSSVKWVEVWLHLFLTSALGRGKSLRRFVSPAICPDIYCTGGWLSPLAGLDR
jgi:hypothetical protein